MSCRVTVMTVKLITGLIERVLFRIKVDSFIKTIKKCIKDEILQDLKPSGHFCGSQIQPDGRVMSTFI